MKTKLIIGLALLTAMNAVTSCSKDSDPTSDLEDMTNVNEGKAEQTDSDKNAEEPVIYMLPETRNIELSSEQRVMVGKNNAFTFNLYKTASSADQQKGKSLVIVISNLKVYHPF